MDLISRQDADVTDTNVGDTIYRQDAIDALWKALFEYEDKTEKQFQESDDLDIGDWMVHRIFVQNMSDIDRQTILNMPSAEPVRMKGRWENDSYGAMDDGEHLMTRCSICGTAYEYGHDDRYCGFCGASMSEGEEDE